MSKQTDHVMSLEKLQELTLKEIYAYAREFKIPYYSQMNKKELIMAVLRAQEESQGFFTVSGVLDITGNEFGFLRPINYSPSQEDIYISNSQIRRFDFRNDIYKFRICKEITFFIFSCFGLYFVV